MEYKKYVIFEDNESFDIEADDILIVEFNDGVFNILRPIFAGQLEEYETPISLIRNQKKNHTYKEYTKIRKRLDIKNLKVGDEITREDLSNMGFNRVGYDSQVCGLLNNENVSEYQWMISDDVGNVVIYGDIGNSWCKIMYCTNMTKEDKGL